MAEPPSARALPGDCVIALDVGGTGMKGVLLDRALVPLATVRRSTPRRQGPDAVVDAVAATLRELDVLARSAARTVRHAGVVVPGIVDEPAGRALRAVNLGWRDVPLAAVLTRRTGLPVILGHDVRAAGTAEALVGAARGAREVLCVAVGTGVAAAVICDGRPLTGAGLAGELGHLVVAPDGDPCACGGRGCLETVASAAAVEAAYAARAGRAPAGAAEVAARVAGGDPVARAVWERAADGLATALAAATTLLGTELVVLGGGLAESGELLLAPVREGLARRLTFQRVPRVVRAELGEAAGRVGAGIAAWRAADGVPLAPVPLGRGPVGVASR
ncbi:ROK family protein [Streptomyces chumphonensis]|nr:ROK family protein [Streptomyces chumphonensis]